MIELLRIMLMRELNIMIRSQLIKDLATNAINDF